MTLTESANHPTVDNHLTATALREWVGRHTWAEEHAVLVHLPQVFVDRVDQNVAQHRGYFAYPPLGLLYLAAAVQREDVHCCLVDLNFVVLNAVRESAVLDLDNVWRACLTKRMAGLTRPLICVSYMFESMHAILEKVCVHLRKICPGACIAVGGVSATAAPETILETGLGDIVFAHEAESVIAAFYTFLRDPAAPVPPNISILDSGGAVLSSPRMLGGPVDLDIRDAYALIPISDYHRVGALSNFSRMNGVDVPFATVNSRRGCRGRCSFCGVRGFSGKGVRRRSVSRVVDEMVFLRKKYGVRHFDWVDDDLLFEHDAAIELFEQISARLPDITWAANNGLLARSLSDEMLAAIEKSGCIGFKIGVESGNPAVLKRVRKPLSLPDYYAFCARAAAVPSVFICTNFILGFPEERFGQMLDSLAAAYHGRLDWNSFYLYQPLINTEFSITYGGMGIQDDERNMNPVRWKADREECGSADLVQGYDVLDLNPETIPPRSLLKEIWFTFNALTNFVRLPALETSEEQRILNAIDWLQALRGAYPGDVSMQCVLFYLLRRMDNTSAIATVIRDQAVALLAESPYWRNRDRQFHFSAFLDGALPPVDPRVQRILTMRDPETAGESHEGTA